MGATQLKKQRIEQGICSYCGKAPLVEGEALCQRCLDHVNWLKARVKKRHEARKELKKNG